MSFPRRRESKYFNGLWIPAFAGMTTNGYYAAVFLIENVKKSLNDPGSSPGLKIQDDALLMGFLRASAFTEKHFRLTVIKESSLIFLEPCVIFSAAMGQIILLAITLISWSFLSFSDIMGE